MDRQSYLERDVKISSIGGSTHHWSTSQQNPISCLIHWSHVTWQFLFFFRNCINLEGKTKQGGGWVCIYHVNTSLKNIFIYIYICISEENGSKSLLSINALFNECTLTWDKMENIYFKSPHWYNVIF